MPYLEITEVVLIQCNVVQNDYRQNSRVLYTFVPNRSLGKLLDISPKKFLFLKSFNSDFPYIEVIHILMEILKIKQTLLQLLNKV